MKNAKTHKKRLIEIVRSFQDIKVEFNTEIESLKKSQNKIITQEVKQQNSEVSLNNRVKKKKGMCHSCFSIAMTKLHDQSNF